MAKSTRGEAWNTAYHAIFTETKCIRLTMDQVSAYMGVPKRDVCKRYPDGWNNNGAGDGRGKRIRSIPCWIRSMGCTDAWLHWRRS